MAAVEGMFESLDYPMDVIWLDIDHTDGMRYFTVRCIIQLYVNAIDRPDQTILTFTFIVLHFQCHGSFPLYSILS